MSEEDTRFNQLADQWSAYLDGELSGADADAIGQFVESSEEAKAFVANQKAFGASLKQALVREVASDLPEGLEARIREALAKESPAISEPREPREPRETMEASTERNLRLVASADSAAIPRVEQRIFSRPLAIAASILVVLGLVGGIYALATVGIQSSEQAVYAEDAVQPEMAKLVAAADQLMLELGNGDKTAIVDYMQMVGFQNQIPEATPVFRGHQMKPVLAHRGLVDGKVYEAFCFCTGPMKNHLVEVADNAEPMESPALQRCVVFIVDGNLLPSEREAGQEIWTKHNIGFNISARYDEKTGRSLIVIMNAGINEEDAKSMALPLLEPI